MPGRKNLTEAERARARTLYFDGHFSCAQISRKTGYGKSQIRTALDSPTIGRKSGRPRILTTDQQEELVEFIKASKKNRRMTFLQLSLVLFTGNFGEYVIRYTLRTLGYKRYVAYRKPPISEKNRCLRLQFAKDHESWTVDQWRQVLWTDETWVTGGRHRKTYVTRLPGEELDDTCIMERLQHPHGWMFWGCFSGYGKGPGIFWEKDWGKINADTYQQHTVPIIHGWIQLQQQQGHDLILMQDSAPGHAAVATITELVARGIRVVKWPPYSPDLNPIETCWNKMKDCIECHWGDINTHSYDQLRGYVAEAWKEAIAEEYLEELLVGMPERMKAVIAANGKHTKY